MTKNATGGPTIVYGQLPAQPGTGYQSEYNEDAAPSLFWGGSGILDMRWGYYPFGSPWALGFQGSTYIPVINAIPSTLSATIIAASQTPTLGTALTLATQSTTGLTVLGTALTVYPANIAIPVGALALDGVSGTVVYEKNQSSTGGVQLYDPTKALARNVSISANGVDSNYKVTGYDIYGYAMSETITGNSTTGGVVAGKKAFKYVASVIPGGTTTNSTSIAVGTGDVYGLPLRADSFGDVAINYQTTVITASTGFTVAVTSTATSTTGDVRGTYALQTASNGLRPLQVFVTPRVSNATSSTGLFGVTQA